MPSDAWYGTSPQSWRRSGDVTVTRRGHSHQTGSHGHQTGSHGHQTGHTVTRWSHTVTRWSHKSPDGVTSHQTGSPSHQTQGRSQGGGRRGCAPPLRFSGPRGPKDRESHNSGGSNRNPHRSHEICAETDKKARQGSRGPSDHLGPSEKQGPCDYQGPK